MILRRVWMLSFVCFGLLPLGWSQESAPARAKEPVAKVAGQPIYEEDLIPMIQSQMFQVRKQEYQIKSIAVENLIKQRLLESEAKAMGLSVAALLEQEVNSKAAAATDAEVEAFYLAQKDRINRPLDDVKTQLRQALQQGKLQQAQESFVHRLRDKAEVAVYLNEPKLVLGFDPARVRGNTEAAVTIVEFSDFQCPFCGQGYSVMKAVLAKYDGRVRLAYRDFPLRQIHPQAQGAAEAARCAGEQGKFWEYHDRLFENQSKLDRASLVEHAASVGIDPKQFEGCLASGKFQAQIERDLQEGTGAGVNGTPAFFINGTLISGAQPASAFEKVIDAEMAAGGQKKNQ